MAGLSLKIPQMGDESWPAKSPSLSLKFHGAPLYQPAHSGWRLQKRGHAPQLLRGILLPYSLDERRERCE